MLSHTYYERVAMSDYYLDDNCYDREGSLIFVTGDCSCYDGYVCGKCLSKW